MYQQEDFKVFGKTDIDKKFEILQERIEGLKSSIRNDSKHIERQKKPSPLSKNRLKI